MCPNQRMLYDSFEIPLIITKRDMLRCIFGLGVRKSCIVCSEEDGNKTDFWGRRDEMREGVEDLEGVVAAETGVDDG